MFVANTTGSPLWIVMFFPKELLTPPPAIPPRFKRGGMAGGGRYALCREARKFPHGEPVVL